MISHKFSSKDIIMLLKNEQNSNYSAIVCPKLSMTPKRVGKHNTTRELQTFTVPKLIDIELRQLTRSLPMISP